MLLIARIATLLTILGFGGVVRADDPAWLRYLEEQIFKRIQLTGERRLTYHLQSVTGDREAYNQLTYYGSGARRFTDFGLIRVEGNKVADVLNFDMTILDNRLTDPQGQRVSLDYRRGPLTVNAGDVNAALLNTNRFTTFNRSLRGVQVGYDSGNFRSRALRSETKGDAISASFQGNNSAGPYYLQSSQIVYGSEEVRVDDERMKLGTDYVISYEVGSITFIGRVISPTSTIAVSYEVLGFNSRAGIVQGVGIAYDMGKSGTIGVSAIQQIARGGGSLSTRLEKFQGFGPPSTPYILQFEPLDTATVQIRVDGISQTQGVDFRFDAANKSIFYFTRFMPAERTIDVIYTPRPQGVVQGNRHSIGVDYRLPLGKKGANGNATFSLANGRQSSPTNPLNGTAKGLDVRYRSGKWEWTGSLRDVPATYATVETRGLSRNERALEFGAGYKPTRAMEYGFAHTNSSISSIVPQSEGEPIISTSRFGIARVFARYRPEGSQETWTAEQRRTETRYAEQSTKLDITELAMTRKIGIVMANLAVTRQSGSGPVRENNLLTQKSITSHGIRAGVSLSPLNRLAIQANSSYNLLRVGDKNGRGVDATLNLTYTPSEPWRISTSYLFADSGSLTALSGFQTGFGIGYGGNGFSGGGSSTSFGATDARLWQTQVEYRPSDKVGAFARYYNSRSSGAVSSNSQSDSYGLGVTWDLGAALSIAASYDNSRTTFMDSEARSTARTINFVATGSPAPRLIYRAGVSLLANGGSSAFRQDGSIFELDLQYRLAPRHNLQFTYLNNRSRGYLAQDESGFSLNYQYRIFKSLALNVRYLFREARNRDPLVTTGAYRANGLNFELAFNFGN